MPAKNKWQVKKRGGYWRLIPPGQKASVYACRSFYQAQKKFPERIDMFQ